MKSYNRIRRTAAIIVGLVFFFAGALKLMDPVGAGLKVDDYLDFFHLRLLSSLSVEIAVALAFLEAATGAALIMGVWKRFFAAVTIVLTAFFTLLTLLLAIFNPQMDCGCFGEAIHLTNGQTFLKNLVLCILTAIAFIPYRDFGATKPRKYGTFPVVLLSIAAFAVLELFALPMMDFTPFRPGAELLAGPLGSLPSDDSMETESLMEGGGLSAEFIYEKDGERRSFSLENLPDSTWTYVDTVISADEDSGKGTTAVSLPFRDAEGLSCDSLAASGRALVLSSYNPEKLRPHMWKKIADMLSDASETGFTPVLLVAASHSSIDQTLSKYSLDSLDVDLINRYVYSADRRTLVTLNRSNGGATWFDDGFLVRKWSRNRLPSRSALSEAVESIPMEEMIAYDTRGRMVFQAWLLLIFSIFILI